MKRAAVYFLVAARAFSLEVGHNYDFKQKSGQNVLGAELVSENEETYTVRLKYSTKPIRLAKKDLSDTPVLSKIQSATEKKPLLRSDIVLQASAAFSFATMGKLGSIFKTGYAARLGADWQPFDKTYYRMRALTFVGAFARYDSSPRHVQLASGFLGPKFHVASLQTWGIEIFASPLFGVSYVDLKGYTFATNYWTFAALGIVSAEKKWNAVAFAMQVYVNYLFDDSVQFETTGVAVAVRYPFGKADAY